MQQPGLTRSKLREACAAVAIAALVLASATPVRAQEDASAQAAPQTALERIRSTGLLALGYATDARPLSYRDASGKAAGFVVGICERVAGQLKSELGVSTVTWVPLGAEDGVQQLKTGKVDLLCSGSPVTLKGRKSVAYSIPIFENGIGALMRTDGSAQLRAALEEQQPPYQPLWRGSTPQAFERRRATVVGRSPAAAWVSERVQTLRLETTVVTVDDYVAGVARMLDGTADVLFGDRANLLDAAKRRAPAEDLVVLGRHFRFQLIALALPRGDEDFRLAVDTALSRLYASPDFGTLYADSFGKPDPDTVDFYRMSFLPE
jgi:ABC-type amino acid transport substrate-binding protein